MLLTIHSYTHSPFVLLGFLWPGDLALFLRDGDESGSESYLFFRWRDRSGVVCCSCCDKDLSEELCLQLSCSPWISPNSDLSVILQPFFPIAELILTGERSGESWRFVLGGEGSGESWRCLLGGDRSGESWRFLLGGDRSGEPCCRSLRGKRLGELFLSCLGGDKSGESCRTRLGGELSGESWRCCLKEEEKLQIKVSLFIFIYWLQGGDRNQKGSGKLQGG